jgi:hypothetical protein
LTSQTLTANRDVDMFKVAVKNLEVYTNEALDGIRGVYRTQVPRIVDGDLKFSK